MNARVKCTQDHLTCVGTVECLQVSVVYQLVFHLIVPSFLPSLSFSPSHGGGGGGLLKKCGRKMVGGVFRSIWQCRWDRGNTASDLTVLLFQFRCSASSSGLAALLAKPQSNHLDLLCALRGHPVTLCKALNMCSTIHTQPDNDGECKITSPEVSAVCFGPFCHVKNGKVKSFRHY